MSTTPSLKDAMSARQIFTKANVVTAIRMYYQLLNWVSANADDKPFEWTTKTVHAEEYVRRIQRGERVWGLRINSYQTAWANPDVVVPFSIQFSPYPETNANYHDTTTWCRGIGFDDYAREQIQLWNTSKNRQHILSTIRDALPKTDLIETVSSFGLGCLRSEQRLHQNLFAGDIATAINDYGHDHWSFNRMWRLRAIFEDTNHCVNFENFMQGQFTKIDVTQMGIFRSQVDLQRLLDEMNENEFVDRFPLPWLNENSLIICLNPVYNVLQIAMEITPPVNGPAGIICPRITGPDEGSGVPDRNPSSTPLWEWITKKCRQIPLGRHFDHDLVLYLRERFV